MVCIHPERVTSLAKHSIYPEIISTNGVISFVSGILAGVAARLMMGQ